MDNKLFARGEATVRLTDKRTGKIAREITAHNKVNLDYIAEVKTNLFTPSTSLAVFLSDYDCPPPENGLIFPMGQICGRGKYNLAASGANGGDYSTLNSVINKQEKGLTTCLFSWDFGAAQAAGTIRSLFLYLDSTMTRNPALTIPAVTWKGTPRYSFENKLFDNAAKTATQYYVADYYTKEIVLHNKSNTLTVSGLARDVDTGHIFVYDAAAKKLYVYASIDTDMTPENILAEYPCTKAYVARGLVKGKYLYYLHSSTDPLASAQISGAVIYLYRYDYTTDAAPEVINSLSCVEAGMTSFVTAEPCAFIDDYLIYHHAVTMGGNVAPVLRVAGSAPKIGFTGVYPNTGTQIVQRVSPNRQVLVSGPIASAGQAPAMAVSHLLLPEPIVKDTQHTLSVNYTLSIQE